MSYPNEKKGHGLASPMSDQQPLHSEFHEDVSAVGQRPTNPRLQTGLAANGDHVDPVPIEERIKANPDAHLDNPLADYSSAELIAFGNQFAHDKQLLDLSIIDNIKVHKIGKKQEKVDADKLAADNNGIIDEKDPGAALWAKAALVAQNPDGYEGIEGLTEEDRAVLRHEKTHKWSQPWELYKMVAMASMAAAVQGMDESVLSGAQLYYPQQFNIDPADPVQGEGRNEWLVGLVNGAPYLCCALVGCWLTEPLNAWFGRRGTIFITACISFATCIWGACTNTWWHLFISRFFLGIGIGPKSATVPVYSAECAPTAIRGALIMMWQMWTAFGIMFGYAADLAFHKVPNKPHITGLNWRLMLGSAGFPAVLVALQVWFSPESPRWLIKNNRYQDAFKAMYRLRGNKLLAARDIFFIHVLLQEEEAIVASAGNRWVELFTLPRVRRATLASTIVMFGQQFCGVNAIVYYTSTIFKQAGFGNTEALLASWGFGMLNWIFALPAMLTIDTFGRRSLLLLTFPLMAIFLLLAGFSFWIPEENKAHIGIITLGIYLYTIVYSSGEGPVPFTYSAECYPLAHRDIGMSWATAVTWFFNFVISLTFPALLRAFTPQGAFGWYAAWNAILWCLVLLFLPETKGLSLEELDRVFSVPTKKQAWHGIKEIPYFINKYIFRRDVYLEPLVKTNTLENRPTYAAKRDIQHHEKGEKQV